MKEERHVSKVNKPLRKKVYMFNRTWYPEDYWHFGLTWIKADKLAELETLWKLFVIDIFAGIVLVYLLLFIKSPHFLRVDEFDLFVYLLLVVIGITGHVSIKFDSLLLMACTISSHILVLQFEIILILIQFMYNTETHKDRFKYSLSLLLRFIIVSHSLLVLLTAAKSC